MHPNTYLWLHELDREREASQKALERAARGGQRDETQPRGGISLTRALARARAAVSNVHLGGPGTETPVTGPTGA